MTSTHSLFSVIISMSVQCASSDVCQLRRIGIALKINHRKTVRLTLQTTRYRTPPNWSHCQFQQWKTSLGRPSDSANDVSLFGNKLKQLLFPQHIISTLHITHGAMHMVFNKQSPPRMANTYLSVSFTYNPSTALVCVSQFRTHTQFSHANVNSMGDWRLESVESV